jgi:hypothetical protein
MIKKVLATLVGILIVFSCSDGVEDSVDSEITINDWLNLDQESVDENGAESSIDDTKPSKDLDSNPEVFSSFPVFGDHEYYLFQNGELSYFQVNPSPIKRNDEIQLGGYVDLEWSVVDNIVTSSNGFRTLEGKEESYLILNESDFYLTISMHPKVIVFHEEGIDYTRLNSKERVFEYFDEIDFSRYEETVYDPGPLSAENGIELVEASSHAIGNWRNMTVQFDPGRIVDFLTLYGTAASYLFNNHLAWVEGAEGPGIGEYLEIEFTWPAKTLYVLGGFIDYLDLSLYKQYARPKILEVVDSTTGDSLAIREIDDIVNFYRFDLSRESEKVRIVIRDVYEGKSETKDMTAISAVFNIHPFFESEEYLELLPRSWEKTEKFRD